VKPHTHIVIIPTILKIQYSTVLSLEHNNIIYPRPLLILISSRLTMSLPFRQLSQQHRTLSAVLTHRSLNHVLTLPQLQCNTTTPLRYLSNAQAAVATRMKHVADTEGEAEVEADVAVDDSDDLMSVISRTNSSSSNSNSKTGRNHDFDYSKLQSLFSKQPVDTSQHTIASSTGKAHTSIKSSSSFTGNNDDNTTTQQSTSQSLHPDTLEMNNLLRLSLRNRFNINELYPIQYEAFTPVVEGRDMIGRSRTGTGKFMMLGNEGIQLFVKSPRR